MSQNTSIAILTNSAPETGADDYVLKHNRTEGNRSTYHVDGEHTDASQALVQFYRTDPKPGGGTRGARKSAVKSTTDVPVLNAEGSGDVTMQIVFNTSATRPVGVDEAVFQAKLNEHRALLGDDAVITALMVDGDI
jgi:hypothetical protein